MSPVTEVLLIALCLFVQGLFSGSEIAIVGSDRLLLCSRADAGDKSAIRVLSLLEHPTQLVGTCLIGTNTATITGATLVAHALGRFGQVPELLVVAVYTPLTIVFAEMVPKSVFHQNATTIAPIVARPIAALSVLVRPALWAVEQATRLILMVLGVHGAQVHAVRREDIQLLLDSATTTDIHDEEKEMILRVFDFSETQVMDTMVPLIEVVAVSETASCAEARAAMVEHGFSRLPVFRKRIDRIVGMVMHSDLLFTPDDTLPVGRLMHEVMFVPETKRVDELFVDLRRKRARIAVAVDEYGGAVGLISMEDILEEIVGDIEDEFDRRRPLVRKIGERQWLASGRVEAEDLASRTGFEMPDGEYETLAGFLLSQLGHVPAVGERLTWGGYVFTVALANERAILEVDVQSTVPRTAREI
jgi:CBS domain containing-hemolysin-like protein